MGARGRGLAGDARARARAGDLSSRPRRTVVAAALAASFVAAGAPDADRAEAQRVPRTFVEAESVLVHGTYPPRESSCVGGGTRAPLHLRLTGRVEVGKALDGTMFVVNELPFETYLEGLAEVPRNWPEAALDAQVIAARTYALQGLGSRSGTEESLDYDLCATDACQVYRGLGISHGPWGERWRAAVERTRGLALLYEGRPASTLYFSTSNGRTYDNEDVFSGAGPLPYLRSVPEDDDGASPVSRWGARIPLADVARFLRSSGEWGDGSVQSIVQEGDELAIRGSGRTVRMSLASFRITVNDRSTCLDPGTYPGADLEEDGDYRLPQTIPSRWYDARTEDGALIAEGRGWGHGVGMVQWGAHGKARRGLSAADILAHYYGGLRPSDGSPPPTIRVGVATGLESVTLVADGVRDKGTRLAGAGPWLVEPGEPYRVRATKAPPPALSAEVVRAPSSARAGERATIRLDARSNVDVRVTLVAADGTALPVPGGRPHERGEFAHRFLVPREANGSYGIAVSLSDGIDTIELRAPGRVRVLPAPAAAPSSPSARPTAIAAPSEPGSRAPVALAVLATLLALTVVVVVVAVRRTR